MPCAAATALPSSTSPETSARRSGRSQTRPCVRPVSAPIGFVDALKITLRHCGPRASATACVGMPAARARVGEPLDLGERRRLRLERAERRVALHVPLHVAGLEDLSGGERRAADHALDVRARAPPRCRCRSARSRRSRRRTRARSRAIAGSVCIAFVATMPKSHGGSSCRVGRRAQAPEHVARAREPQPVRVDRVDVRAATRRTPTPRRRRAARGSRRTASRPRRSRRCRSSSSSSPPWP